MQRAQGKMLREYFSGVPVENLYRLEHEGTEDHLFQYRTKKMRKGEAGGVRT